MNPEARKALTPGPWTLGARSGGLQYINAPGRIGFICVSNASEADAHLVVASRDLLRSVHALLSVIDNHLTHFSRSREADAARAALRKAEGWES